MKKILVIASLNALCCGVAFAQTFAAGNISTAIGGSVYGGLESGIVENGTSVIIEKEGSVGTVYGGGVADSVVNGGTNVEVYGQVSSIYGGGNGIVNGGTNVIIDTEYDNIGRIVGAGQGADVTGDVTVTLKNGTISDVFNGGSRDGGNVDGNIKINMTGGTVKGYLVGGNYQSKNNVVNGNIDISVTGGSASYGIRGGSVGGAYDQVVNGNINVYIGGNAYIGNNEEAFSSAGSYATVKDVTVTVAENAVVDGTIYGGGGRTVTDSAISDMKADKVVATSEIKKSAENVKINIEGGTVNGDIYGGALKYSGVNSTEINLTGGVVNGNIYAGGGENGTGISTLVSEGAKINITGGEITGNVYASGSNSTSVIKGDVVVTVTSDAAIGGTIYGTTNGAIVEGTKTLILDGVSTPLVTVSETKVINAEGFDNVTINSGNVVELSLKDVDTLAVEQGALVSLTEDSSFNKLFVDMSASELEETTIVELSEIFGDSISVVTSELAKDGSSAVLLDKNQNLFEAKVIGSSLVVTNEIPEPSTYAAIFGALALGFVIYRRRK